MHTRYTDVRASCRDAHPITLLCHFSGQETMLISRVCRCACLMLAVGSAFWAASATPSEREAADTQPEPDRRSADFRPRPAQVPNLSPEHPLFPALKDARRWL